MKPNTQHKQGKDKSQPPPTSTSQQVEAAAGVPYDALRAYLDGALRSHWLGTPAPAWLPDEGPGESGARAGGTTRTAQQVQTAGGASTSSRAGLEAGPLLQAGEASRQLQPAPHDEQIERKAAQAARAVQQAKEAARQRRGIVIPPPATLQGTPGVGIVCIRKAPSTSANNSSSLPRPYLPSSPHRLGFTPAAPAPWHLATQPWPASWVLLCRCARRATTGRQGVCVLGLGGEAPGSRGPSAGGSQASAGGGCLRPGGMPLLSQPTKPSLPPMLSPASEA